MASLPDLAFAAPLPWVAKPRLGTFACRPVPAVRRRHAAPLRMGLFDSLKNAVSTTLKDLGSEPTSTTRMGPPPEEILASYQEKVGAINALEDTIEAMTDEQLRDAALQLRQTTADGQQPDVPFCFALVREAAFRTLSLRHYDVQLMGGLALLDGRVAEMATGEGKTLVATLPIFVKALDGRGAHVVTVNDYLAERDAATMGQVFRFLGLSCGVVTSASTTPDRVSAYSADITYVTNSELGFDYLRDNLALSKDELVLQRPFHFCVVDEADSILIDEARTPLIISGSVDAPTVKYANAAKIAAVLQKDFHYNVSEKEQMVSLSEQGYSQVEQILKIDDLLNPSDPWAPYIVNALKAKELFEKDVNYITRGNEVLIVDEFTGRVMEGRRWANGLHQSVEAKEGLKVSSETQTNASISYQSFFRLFPTVSGMTGTAETERQEFLDIYGLDVLSIPTALPVARKDYPDAVFKTEDGKYRAVMREVARVHPTGQPILIGTTSVESSERLSELLTEVEVPHNVLNAKPENVARESDIVAQAGRKFAITIATNMAGRGTDILLGGSAKYYAAAKLLTTLGADKNKPLTFPCDLPDDLDSELLELDPAKGALSGESLESLVRRALEGRHAESGDNEIVSTLRKIGHRILDEYDVVLAREREEVLELGGLYVMGTARHESRRIDNQLRGRSGRQGDPGMSRFFLSLNDNLFRVFGGDKVSGLLSSFRVDEDTPIENALVNRTLDGAQKNVEEYYSEVRKKLFEFDEVMTQQRATIYEARRSLVVGDDEELLKKMTEYCLKTLAEILPSYLKAGSNDWEGLSRKVDQFFPGIENLSSDSLQTLGSSEEVAKWLDDQVADLVQRKWNTLEERRKGMAPEVVRYIVLTQIDNLWRAHMKSMDFVKEGAGLRVYENVKPLDAYREEGLEMFKGMVDGVRRNSVYSLFQYKLPAAGKGKKARGKARK